MLVRITESSYRDGPYGLLMKYSISYYPNGYRNDKGDYVPPSRDIYLKKYLSRKGE